MKEFNSLKLNSKNIETNVDDLNTNLTYGVGLKTVPNSRLKIDIDVSKKEPYEIIFTLNEENKNLAEYIEITAKENTKTIVVIRYEAKSNVEGFHNGIIKVFAKSKALVDVVILNFLNENTNNFLSIENELEEGSNVKYTVVDFGGKISITNYYSNLKGDYSNNEINTIYLGNKEQVFDLNYIAQLRGVKSNANIDVQGAIKDNAKKNFKGTLDFKRGCKKAVGRENEYCTILSDKAKSLALPMLLCDEEDVEGEHSTSAGKIGEKELFYMMSRGFELKEALKLMVRAKFNKVIENIPNEELKTRILDEIDNKLD